MSIYRVSFLACGEVTVRTGLNPAHTLVVADIEPGQLCDLLQQAFQQELSPQYIETFVAECKARGLPEGGDKRGSQP